jgi:hypothetical protein
MSKPHVAHPENRLNRGSCGGPKRGVFLQNLVNLPDDLDLVGLHISLISISGAC